MRPPIRSIVSLTSRHSSRSTHSNRHRPAVVAAAVVLGLFSQSPRHHRTTCLGCDTHVDDFLRRASVGMGRTDPAYRLVTD